MDLPGVLGAARRRAVVVLACVLAGLLGGFYAGHVPARTYEASTRVLVGVPTGSDLTQGVAAAQLSGAYVVTFSRFVTSPSVAAQVAAELHLPLSAAQVAGGLSAQPLPGTFLIEVTDRSQDPARAAAVANATAAVLQATVNRLDANGPGLRITVVDDATPPTSPVSPRAGRSLLDGFVLGLLAGLVAAGLLELLDRTVRTPGRAEVVADAPLLTVVARHEVPIPTGDGAGLLEPYRVLRGALQVGGPEPRVRTVAVVAASPGAGATTTAVNLALVVAGAGREVVLVDADLRTGALGQLTGLGRGAGLAAVLRGASTVGRALRPWRTDLDVLTAGVPAVDPADLLEGRRLERTVAAMAARADLVVIDTPPFLSYTDGTAIVAAAEVVVVVARAGWTRTAELAETVRRLRSAGATVAGVVLNAADRWEGRTAAYGSAAPPRRFVGAGRRGAAAAGRGPLHLTPVHNREGLVEPAPRTDQRTAAVGALRPNAGSAAAAAPAAARVGTNPDREGVPAAADQPALTDQADAATSTSGSASGTAATATGAAGATASGAETASVAARHPRPRAASRQSPAGTRTRAAGSRGSRGGSAQQSRETD